MAFQTKGLILLVNLYESGQNGTKIGVESICTTLVRAPNDDRALRIRRKSLEPIRAVMKPGIAFSIYSPAHHCKHLANHYSTNVLFGQARNGSRDGFCKVAFGD